MSEIDQISQKISVDLIEEAYNYMKHTPLIKSPLLHLNVQTSGNKKIYIKCENLQPYGSFKARGACFAMSRLSEDQRNAGVCAASAGNFAQGLGYMAKQFRSPCTALVPETIPNTKLSRILELDVTVKKVPFNSWWQAILNRQIDGCDDMTFIHPCDVNVIAGHGTIGLEILEDLPEVDAVVSPYGSGGLITGVASALKAKKPGVKVVACEPDCAAPLKYSFEQGRPSVLEKHESSFVDGMGGKQVLEEMWPYVSHLVDYSMPVSLQEIVDAVRLLIDRNSVISEGAGAATVAAALKDTTLEGNIVCIISGGNIDLNKLADICQGRIPSNG